MPRIPRINAGGIIYHVLNRGNARLRVFESAGDYMAFLKIMGEAHERVPMRLLGYCLMPNHWHLILWPHKDHDLSRYMQWLTLTHTQRWEAAHEMVGMGHLYGSRFKNIPVQDDHYYLTLCRYVERNALHAGLVTKAEDWQWSSLHQRLKGNKGERPPLADSPMPLPDNWLALVNERQSEADVAEIRQCTLRGMPFGGEAWTRETAKRFGIQSSTCRGRPRRK